MHLYSVTEKSLPRITLFLKNFKTTTGNPLCKAQKYILPIFGKHQTYHIFKPFNTTIWGFRITKGAMN